MTEELDPVQVKYGRVKGVHFVSDPSRSNIIVVGTAWRSVVQRADEHLDLVLPAKIPKGA